MIYTYECPLCGDKTDHQVRVAKRHEPQPCGREDCDGMAEYQITFNRMDTHARDIPEQGVIYSERQLDRGWRDKGTNRNPGGAGRTLHFDQKR
jgi:hypothetical protein